MEKLSIIHPSNISSCESYRIGLINNEKIPLADTPGINGYKLEQLIEVLKNWESDGTRHCIMDFVFPDLEIMKKRFIYSTEKLDNFKVILIGKENCSPWAKAALVNLETRNIIFRSSTFDKNYTSKEGSMYSKKTTKKSHDKYWVVHGRLFNADASFWLMLKDKFRELF